MRTSDCETVDDILTEFAKRDPSGYLVWGSKISSAYCEDVKNRENEARGANGLNDALNAEVKRLAAENEKLKFDNLHLKSVQRQAGEVIIEQTNKVEANDAEIAELRGALKKAYATLYSISCARYGEGLTCTDSIHELVTMARECADELYADENLRKAMEGGNNAANV